MPPQVDCVAVFPASDRVVSGSRENTLKLWDAASNECLATWEGHSGEVRRRSVLKSGIRGRVRRSYSI